MSTPPPHGMSDAEYDVIEAAVAETARGRRFLSEFARRNRVAETRQLLEAMTRLEAAVGGGTAAVPSASMRLLAQRAYEIAARLGEVADEMRAGGEDQLAAAVDAQARAVAGIVRAATPAPAQPQARHPQARQQQARQPQAPALERPAPRLPPALSPPAPAAAAPTADPRLAALASLDALTLPEKLALFR